MFKLHKKKNNDTASVKSFTETFDYGKRAEKTNAEAMRDIRHTLGYTQAQMAELFNVSLPTISAIESGRFTMRIWKLAAGCDKKPELHLAWWMFTPEYFTSEQYRALYRIHNKYDELEGE